MTKKHEDKKIIAVCCATIRELSVLEPMDAICRRANECGYKVQIFQSFEELAGYESVYEGEESVFELINYEKLAGIIIFSERIKDPAVIDSIVSKAKALDVPVVSFDRKVDGCFNVIFDYADAFEQIVRHIVEFHNCKDIFVMAGMKDNDFSDERLNVVRRVMKENNLELPDENIAYGDFWEFPTKSAMEDFFNSGRKLPDAFIAMNDTMATVIIDEIQKRGYKVPDDVLVTGFDGIYLSEYFVPKITTAKQQLDVAGKKSVDIILDYLNCQYEDPYDVTVAFKMLVRQSCSCHGLDVKGIAGTVRDLYSNFETSKRFSGYMEEMTRRMSSTPTITYFSGEADGYSHFLENHTRVLLCVYKDYLTNDKDFYNEMCWGYQGFRESTKNMVVLADCGNGTDRSLHMKLFDREEIMPEADAFLDKYVNVIIAPLHCGKEIFGHVVVDYMVGDRDGYKTKMYINNISNMLHLIKQQNLLANSNRELIATKNELERMYIYDLLTGVLNRRGFYQKYDEIKSSKPLGSYAVILADLDDLKLINDNYGHQEGDFAIKTFGEVLSTVVGFKGISARFGGDEFAALITGVDKSTYDAEILVREMQSIVDRRDDVKAKPYNLKFSLGMVISEWDDNSELEALLNGADKNLYQMKRQHHEGINDRRNRR